MKAWQAALGRVPSLSCHQTYRRTHPYRPTNPSGNGLRWKLSLDQDPFTPTAQVSPGWGTQMHAMRPQLRTKGSIKSLPESRGWSPKPEEAGRGPRACSIPLLPPFPVDAMKNGKSRCSGDERSERQACRGDGYRQQGNYFRWVGPSPPSPSLGCCSERIQFKPLHSTSKPFLATYLHGQLATRKPQLRLPQF